MKSCAVFLSNLFIFVFFFTSIFSVFATGLGTRSVKETMKNIYIFCIFELSITLQCFWDIYCTMVFFGSAYFSTIVNIKVI